MDWWGAEQDSKKEKEEQETQSHISNVHSDFKTNFLNTDWAEIYTKFCKHLYVGISPPNLQISLTTRRISLIKL